MNATEPLLWSDFEALWEKHYTAIQQYIFKRTSDFHLAEDLASECFLKALEAICNGKGPNSHTSGWIYRIAHNLVIDHYRQRDHARAVSLDRVLGIADDSNDPVAAMESTFDSQVIHSIVNRLPPVQAQVLQLRFFEGYSSDEVCATVGKDYGAVKGITQRAFVNAFNCLSSEKRNVKQNNCTSKIEKLLRKNGPMTARELTTASRQNVNVVYGVLYEYSNLFVKVGKGGMNNAYKWGLVGIHNKEVNYESFT